MARPKKDSPVVDMRSNISLDDIGSEISGLFDKHIIGGEKIDWNKDSVGESTQVVDKYAIDFTVQAPNIIEWSTGEKFLNQPSLFDYKRQYQTIRDLFQLRCPLCNKLDRQSIDCWDKNREYLESENLLAWSPKYHDDVCPSCNTTRREFETDGIFKRYNTFVACVGMRSGKSVMAGAYLGTYIEHLIITLGNPSSYFDVFPGQPFEVAFTATTEVQSEGTIYAYYRAAREQAPWIQAYIEHLKQEETRRGLFKQTLYNETNKTIYYKELNTEFNSLHSNCFVGGTDILLSDYTRKKIKDVRIGDCVIDKSGNKQIVENAWCETPPDKVVEISLYGGNKFMCTLNHKFPAYVWPHKCACGCGTDVTAGRSFIKGHQGNGRKFPMVVVDGGGGHIRRLPVGYKPIQDILAGELRKDDYLMMPRKFEEVKTKISEDMARLLGYYVAEGCSNRTSYKSGYKLLGSEFCLGSHEADTWVADIKLICKRYNIHYNTYFLTTAAACRTTTSGPEAIKMASWLEANGGHFAKQKRLSEEVMRWPLKLKMELIKGMFRGDGTHYFNIQYKEPSWKKRPCISYGTASKALAYQVQIILCHLGIYAGVVEHNRKITKYNKENTKQYYVNIGGEQVIDLAEKIWGKENKFKDFVRSSATRSFCRVDDSFIYIPIKNIKVLDNKEPVYNLTISNDHSYIVNGVGTYNSGGLAGRTRVWAVVDELSRFETSVGESRRGAKEVYNVIDNGLATVRGETDRRQLPYIFGMMNAVSSPIHNSDMTMKLLKTAKKDKNVFAVHYPTWKFNPKITRESLESRFQRDPIGAERDFGANPPNAEMPLITDEERFRKCINPNLKPKATFEDSTPVDGMGRMYAGKILKHADFDKLTSYYIAGDAGKSKDSFALACGHGEYKDVHTPNGIEKKWCTIMDWCVTIRPSVKPRKTIYYDCIVDILNRLRLRQKIQLVAFDHWQSESILQDIANMQIETVTYNVKAEDYLRFVIDAYEGKVQMIAADKDDEYKDPYAPDGRGMTDYGRVIHELLNLERSSDLKTVDHRSNEHNDSAAVVTMVHKNVQDQVSTTGKSKNFKNAMSVAVQSGLMPTSTRFGFWG